MRRFLVCFIAMSFTMGVAARAEVDVAPLLKKIRDVAPKGKGHREAISAMQALSTARAEQLPTILAGMDGAGPLATNWIRAAVESVAQRATKAGQKLPARDLEAFLSDTSHAPRARRLAYELLVRSDPAAKDRWDSKFLNDPSLELRRVTVAQLMRSAMKQKDKDRQLAVGTYRKALGGARDIDQIKSIAESLRELKEKVDLPKHFGFVMRWHLIAPFDNTDMKGFNVAYAPERSIDLSAKLKGKDSDLSWSEHKTSDEFGNVDLNKVIAKHKGAVGYAYTEFIADKAQDVQLRLGCINANKIWLNGKLLTANEVYHARTDIDQYVADGRLRKGRNSILLKICQNEQEEPWAQNWKFQLRVCDQYGTAVLSEDRPSSAKSGE